LVTIAHPAQPKGDTMRFLSALFIAFAISLNSSFAQIPGPPEPREEITQKDADVIESAIDVSVTVHCGKGMGSGLLFTREIQIGDKTENITFVWTAAHVVENFVKPKVIKNPFTGEERTEQVDELYIVKEVTENNTKVGEIRLDCSVVHFGGEGDEDIALLMVDKHNALTQSVKFSTSISKVGTNLFHVGSFFGQSGANSFSRGVMSYLNRKVEAPDGNTYIFDQTTANACVGSSGGGIYLENGECVGMVVRVAQHVITFIIPTRKIRNYAEKNNIVWAMDRSVPMPSYDDLIMLTLETK